MKIKHSVLDHLSEYSAHLKNLDDTDRYTRFGYAVNAQAIDQLILNILYNQKDHHIFTYKSNEQIVGFGHLARDDNNWELAVSVDKQYQGQGIANELMNHMIAWGKTHGVHVVYMHCITDNKKIQHLARKHGLKTIERVGTDVTAQVELPDPTPVDYMVGLAQEQSELATDIMKLQRRWIKRWTNPELDK